MDTHRGGFAIRTVATAALALSLLLPAASQAGNVFFGTCEGRLSATMVGPFPEQNLNFPLSDTGNCTGTDTELKVMDGTNAQGGYGKAQWEASLTREIEFLAPGVFVHRGIGRTKATAYQQGVDNGKFWSYHPYVESGFAHQFRMYFTVDGPTPIKLKAQIHASKVDGVSAFEDQIALYDQSIELWRLDGRLNAPEITSGEFQYVLVPGRNYRLEMYPFGRSIVGNCGYTGCADNPWRLAENFTDWSYELTFNYTPPVIDLQSLTLKQAEVAGCKKVTGTVTLTNPAPEGGFNVTLTDTLAAATLPAVVTVPAGATTKTFTIATTQVLAKQTGQVTATGADKGLSAPLSVRPIGPLSVSLSPTAVTGGSPVTGSVRLECPTNLAPIEVQLASASAAAAYPVAASVFVPQGMSSATFGVATNPVLAKATAAISGTANGITKSKVLTVNVAAAVSPTSLKFGSVVLGTTSAPLNATLTNKGAAAFSVSSISLTGTAASWFGQTNDCPASLAPGTSCTISVTFTPQAVASKSAKLTIATSATATPLSVSLSGTGVLPP